MQIITSPQNQHVKDLAALRERAERLRTGRFIAESEKLVGEAMTAGIVEELVVSESYMASHEVEPDTVLADRVFAKLSGFTTPEGVLAVCRYPECAANKQLPESGLVIMLEALQDPGNVGTVIRTADALGAAAVVCTEGTADPYSPKVLRAAMGSIFRLPVIEMRETELFAELKSRGAKLLAADMGGVPVYELPKDAVSGCCVLAIGNEGNGISSVLRETADTIVSVPMRGGAESLNAAVACAILTAEIIHIVG